MIKKHKNKNEYLLVANRLWVRNFATCIAPHDINNLTSRSDYNLLMENELANRSLNLPNIGSENFTHPKCLIVSDGHDFKKMYDVLESLPPDVCIIGVNRSLCKWKRDDTLIKRKMNYFLANNPYAECMGYLPSHNYWPRCIVSSRTYPGFVKRYNGLIYTYAPVTDECFGGNTSRYYQIDDYRNPVCAAIGLAYRFKVKKLGLLCCDDVFDHERPAAEQLPNGMWMYPQHKLSHSLIDGNLFWLTHQENEIQAVDCSCGPFYSNVPYIHAGALTEFFNDK